MNSHQLLMKSLFKALGIECAIFLFYGLLPYIDGRLDLAGMIQQIVLGVLCTAFLTWLFYTLSSRRRR